MRAAVLSDDGLSLREWPAPEPAAGEALVSLSKVGICGSDVHFVLDGTAKTAFLPIILGHEPCGRVEALGPDTQGPAPGTRVAIIPLLHCGACARCRAGRTVICAESQCIGAERHGCWADLAVVPVENLVEVPAGLSDDLAAVATDSVATAYHAVATRGGVRPGSRVAVWGTGGLGLSAVGIAKALGAASVIAVDPRAEARAWALETGADEAIEPDGAVKRIAGDGGVDVALEFVGRAATMDGAVRCLDDGGRAVIVGIGSEQAAAGRQMSLVVRERDVVGSYGAEPDEVRTVVRMLDSGELKLPRVVGDVIPLEDVASGLRRVARGDTGGSRIVLDLAGDALMGGVLDGKVAIVTGSARGIGLATAARLSAEGASVVICDLDGDEASAAAAGLPGEAAVFTADLTQGDAPDRLVGAAIDAFGRLDIVVNNAGYTLDGVMHKLTDDAFQRMLDIHAVVPFRVLRAAAPHLREPAKAERAEGVEVFRKVVNVSSISGTMGNAGQVNYAAGKMALVGITRALAKEWGQFKINVNAIAFGSVQTRLTASNQAGNTISVAGETVTLGIPDALVNSGAASIPLGREATPEDAANGIFLLCSPWSDFVHGQVLHVTGGQIGGMTG